MRFLATNSEIEATLANLLERCRRVRWAIAWASSNTRGFQLLLAHRAKIAQLTVGTHFYQTDPKFIAAFLKHPKAQFVLNPSGVFHPKLYYFDHGRSCWDCIVGSPNFTQAAFTANSESAVWISHEDSGAMEAREEILDAFDRYRAFGGNVGRDDLEAYRAVWARQQKRLGPLSGMYAQLTSKRKPPRSPLDLPLFKESWRQYFRSVLKEDTEQTKSRLAVLEEAARLFKKHQRFSAMDDAGRRGIAGFVTTDAFQWHWFGRTKPRRAFMRAVNERNPKVSSALDRIPLTGEVGRTDFDAFVKLFLSAFEKREFTAATRLLAFKRPDYFVCLTSRNRKPLCDEFGIARTVNVDDYWPGVVERILDSNWWNSPEPAGGLARRIWRCRAAFLDARFYY